MKTLLKKNSIYFPFFSIVVLVFILPLETCPLRGQVVQKKHIQASDYDTLGDLQFHKPSQNGNWSCFSMIYKNGRDTLYLKSTFNKKIYSFPLGSKSDFIGNSDFIYQNSDGLHILDLHTNKQQIISDVINYYCSQDFGEIVILIKPKSSKVQSLLVMNTKGQTLKRIENITTIKMSPGGKKLLFSVRHDTLNSIGILELGHQIKTKWLITGTSGTFKMLTWEKKAAALSFLINDKIVTGKNTLYYYIINNGLIHYLDPKTLKGFPAEMDIDDKTDYPITISDDLERVFFGIIPNNHGQTKIDIPSDSEVEIWNSSDKQIYPMMQKTDRSEKRGRLAMWFPLSGNFTLVSSPDLPKVILTGNVLNALLSDPKKYEPHFEYDAPRDFYIMNLLTGKKELFLRNKTVSPVEPLPIPSPSGKYISYMQQENCWIYDIYSKKHINLTNSIATKDSLSLNKKRLKDFSFTLLGWTPEDKDIVLCDTYDIWIAAPDGSYIKRLTHGREKQIQFRIYNPEYFSGVQKSYDGWINKTINLSNVLILKANGEDGKTGFFKWETNVGEMPIAYDDFYIDQLYTADKGKIIFYQTQKFDQPPTIMVRKATVTNTVFKSSPHQANYYWGTSALINFKNVDGKRLQALLYYPADYDPSKKYPMIVNVYEKQTQNLYKYLKPSLENEAGFNPTVLTSQGYFILCPNIISQKQNEGPSALTATVAAVQEIISKGLVYPDKIGLIGHSFGGFETDYIITQTGIFAAAVAGAAITNINSYYHTVDWDTGWPSMNYFTIGQLKMTQPPSEIPEIYDRNSPIVHVNNVSTPLLSYAGKEDNHVDWHQTVEFHMALRRLGKKNIMLLYPKEKHTFIDPVNQKDLTQKISQWFGHYLKNELTAPWFEKE